MLKIIATLLLTRTAADRYHDHTTGREYLTVHCTQTAHLMAGRLETDARGRRWVVFLDSDGEEEGECQLAPDRR